MDTAATIVMFTMSAIAIPVGAWGVNRIIIHDQWLALQAQELSHIKERVDEIHDLLTEQNKHERYIR